MRAKLLHYHEFKMQCDRLTSNAIMALLTPSCHLYVTPPIEYQSVCPIVIIGSEKGGQHYLAGVGGGGTPFGRLDRKPGTLYTLCLHAFTPPPPLPFLMPICKSPSGAAVSLMHTVISLRVFAFSPDNSHDFSPLFFGISYRYLKNGQRKQQLIPVDLV